jgi:formylglycine-generating enzyme required for sulfatase activity
VRRRASVYEWCADAYDKGYYAISPKRDPKGPDAGPNASRVLRGGSWSVDGHLCRAALRRHFVPGYRYIFIGFRVVVRPGARTP